MAVKTFSYQYSADLRRDDGEIFLSRWSLVEVIHVAWFFHNVTGSMVEVSISFSLFQNLEREKIKTETLSWTILFTIVCYRVMDIKTSQI